MKVIHAKTGKNVVAGAGGRKDPRTVEHEELLAEECRVTRLKAGNSFSGVCRGRHARGKHRA